LHKLLLKLIAGGAAHFVNKLQIRRLMSGEFAQVHRARWLDLNQLISRRVT
jgi:hypothetical protein